MKTFERVCIKDFKPYIKRGKIYLTSDEKDGTVTVFTSYWIFDVPVSVFAGGFLFTT